MRGIKTTLAAADNPCRNLGGERCRNQPSNPSNHRGGVSDERQQLLDWQFAFVVLDMRLRQFTYQPFGAVLQISY